MICTRIAIAMNLCLLRLTVLAGRNASSNDVEILRSVLSMQNQSLHQLYYNIDDQIETSFENVTKQVSANLERQLIRTGKLDYRKHSRARTHACTNTKTKTHKQTHLVPL